MARYLYRAVLASGQTRLTDPYMVANYEIQLPIKTSPVQFEFIKELSDDFDGYIYVDDDIIRITATTCLALRGAELRKFKLKKLQERNDT